MILSFIVIDVFISGSKKKCKSQKLRNFRNILFPIFLIFLFVDRKSLVLFKK